MCRYMDHAYRAHYVCLDCHYTKKSDPRGFKWGKGRDEIKCTKCGGRMVAVGQDFRAPRKGSKDWVPLIESIRAGKRFWSCGC
jgi:DNA-directed RNA polymerase subunit RPC12/RpoP